MSGGSCIGLMKQVQYGSADGWVSQNGVDFRAEEENVHAGVEPEEAEHNGSQTAIDSGVVAEVVDVERKQK